MQIHIIGTSHIAKDSIGEIKNAITTYQPDIVAVELDIERAKALFSKEKPKIGFSAIGKVGLQGFIFAKLGQNMQQKLGKWVGVEPGSEMKTAIELAKKNNLEVALIDQPINITLKNFSKAFTWREKFRFLGEVAVSLITPKRQAKKTGINFDISKVPEKELIIKLMQHMQERYPSLYKAIVEDRNKYMVKKIIQIMREKQDKKILVIVGAGHVQGMQELLLKVDIVR